MEAFAMAVALSILFTKRWITFTAFAWAILIGYSRMALGVHYPSDVIAGMIAGTLIGWLVPYVSYLFPLNKKSRPPGAE
jgi:undecaprenyl-diphosphatase